MDYEELETTVLALQALQHNAAELHACADGWPGTVAGACSRDSLQHLLLPCALRAQEAPHRQQSVEAVFQPKGRHGETENRNEPNAYRKP